MADITGLTEIPARKGKQDVLIPVEEIPLNKYCEKCEEFKNTLENFELYSEANDGFTRRCNDCESHRGKKRNAAARRFVVALFGDCASCGQGDVDWNPLELDHVNVDGKTHRDNNAGKTATLFSRIAMTGNKAPDGYELQMLCRQCHAVKTYRNDCPDWFPTFRPSEATLQDYEWQISMRKEWNREEVGV